MWAHSHLIRVEGNGYSQIFRTENAVVCRLLDNIPHRLFVVVIGECSYCEFNSHR